MSPDEVPVGTICTVGHPANGLIARKVEDNTWVYVHNGEKILDFDTIHKALRALWVPGYETTLRAL